jgi:hypothetical protein
MEVNEVGKSARNKFMSFLSGKPMWAFWIAYTVLSGILFGIFYLAMYLMALLWWIPIIVIIAVGMIWGSLSHKGDVPEVLVEKKPDKEV